MKKIYIKFVRYILNFFDFFFQKKIINLLNTRLNQKKIIFFDVGSHFGETIDLFVKYLKIKEFHCFEASPKNFNILWQDQSTPKVLRIYNNKILGGKNWIGVIEKNVPKISKNSEQKLFNWYTIFMLLVFLIFLSWYKEGRN